MRRNLAVLVGSLLVAGVAHADPPKISLYGFVLPTLTYSSSAVESFNQPNASAYTGAGNPALANDPAASRTTFQVAQSRFGLVANPLPNLTGRLEFDFIDFSKASPTTAALPRLRRAVVEIPATEGVTLRFGQDWDLVSPLGPHTYNLVGHYFQSGDIGFMRQQGQILIKEGNWEHALALGLPGSNNTAADGALELDVLPTVALRDTYQASADTKVGISLLASGFRPSAGNADRLFAGVATIFLETKPTEKWELRSEGYYGSNTANIGLQGLGYGSFAKPLANEAGAYVTTHYQLAEKWATFAGVGGAWILNPEGLSPSYTTAGGGLSGTGPGIERNLTARLGLEWIPSAPLKVFIETASLWTRHRLQPADAALYEADRHAIVGQSGVMLSF